MICISVFGQASGHVYDCLKVLKVTVHSAVRDKTHNVESVAGSSVFHC